MMVFKERYTAITIPIIFVTLCENHCETYPPICKTMTTKNTSRTSCVTNSILNFFGKTLYCPPIVNSPNGNPQIISIDNIITIEKVHAPIIDIIMNLPKL